MSNKFRLKNGAVIITLVLVIFGVCAPSLAPAPTPAPQLPPKPDVVSTAAFAIGGAAYAQQAAIGEGMMKKFGIKRRAIPVATDVSRLSLLLL